MPIDSIRASAVSGIQRSLQSASDAGQTIATAFTPSGEGDITGAAVQLSQAETSLRANHRVFGVVKRLEDAVLDILA